MDKTNSELLELLGFYDDLTESQAKAIVKMEKIIADQAQTIALLQGDSEVEEERDAIGE